MEFIKGGFVKLARRETSLEELKHGPACQLAGSHFFVDGREIVQGPGDVVTLYFAILHVGQDEGWRKDSFRQLATFL